MANRNFDFGKLKKSWYNTKLKDGTMLLVGMPMKKTFDKIAGIERLQEDSSSSEVYNSIQDLMSEILSNNKQGKHISQVYLEKEIYNLEEMFAYIGD